jgi:hypothetical protein
LKIITEKMKGKQIPIRYKTGKKIERKEDGIGQSFAKLMDDVCCFRSTNKHRQARAM